MKGIINKKKLIAIILVFSLAFSISAPCQTARAANRIDITLYQDRNFYDRSAPEPTYIGMDCNAISLCATCEGDVADDLIVRITDKRNPEACVCSFAFKADGSVTTIACDLPAETYQVFIIGDDTIKKTYACVVFSVIS